MHFLRLCPGPSEVHDSPWAVQIPHTSKAMVQLLHVSTSMNWCYMYDVHSLCTTCHLLKGLVPPCFDNNGAYNLPGKQWLIMGLVVKLIAFENQCG